MRAIYKFVRGVETHLILASSQRRSLICSESTRAKSHPLSEGINEGMYYYLLLYSWRFSHYSAPTHWLVHGHMTSNNETVSRQMP